MLYLSLTIIIMEQVVLLYSLQLLLSTKPNLFLTSTMMYVCMHTYTLYTYLIRHITININGSQLPT